MSNLPQRKQTRLVGHDYTAAGGYFVTLCAYQRQHLFGTISEETMQLSAIGRLVEKEWAATPLHRPNIQLDVFVIMPNHIHGVVFIEESSPRPTDRAQHAVLPTDRAQHAALPTDRAQHAALPTDRAQHAAPLRAGSLGAFVRAYKSAVRRRVGIELGHQEPLWQRNYYEHIIRNADEYDKIAAYIINNPANWKSDSLN